MCLLLLWGSRVIFLRVFCVCFVKTLILVEYLLVCQKKKLNIAFDRVNSINLCVNLSLLFFFTLSFCNFTVWLKALLDWFFVSTNWFSIVCIAIKFYVCFLVICNTIIVWIFKDIQSNTIIVKNFKIWPLPLKLIKHYFHKTITIFFLWKTLWHCYTSS